MIDPRRWYEEAPVLQRLNNRVTVLRDDVLEGGSKLRFLPFLIDDADEVVYGGPFCGGAPHALSIWGRESGKKVTLFYAMRDRANWHRRQVAAEANGATIVEIYPGYMSTVQARAREYAEEAGAKFLSLGFDLPAAEEPFVDFMERVRRETGSPDQVWCATGSGMLARCLSRGFPHSEVNAVAVGLASRHKAQDFGPNVVLHTAPYKFEKETKQRAPFPSDGNYDRKAWEFCVRQSLGSVLFWNVAG